MEFSASEIASILGGQVKGDPDVKVSSLSKIEEGQTGTISFLGNMKYEPYLYNTAASIVIVPKGFTPSKEITSTLIEVEDAHQAFTQLLVQAQSKISETRKTGIDARSEVSENAKLGKDVFVGCFTIVEAGAQIADDVTLHAQVFIGENVKIGEGTVIHPGVKIYKNTVIGKNCIIHSNAVLGADGFGFTPDSKGKYSKVPQIGNVVIGDDVEVGANTTIDRATLGSTRIHDGVKLDNLIQIAHNVEIGENTVVASQAGIAGSSKVGKNCMIAGQVGIAGHLKVGDYVIIQAQSGLTNDVSDGRRIFGSPAMDVSDFRKSYVYFRKFPQLVKRLETLEKNQDNNKQ